MSRHVGKVLKKTVHEDYDDIYITNDIALLQLSNPFNINDAIQTIPLNQEDVSIGECIYAGWTKYPCVFDQLSYSKATIDSNEECSSFMYTVYEDQLCILTPYSQRVCTDKGSPLVSNGKQVGIHSYIQTGFKTRNIYTKVSSYYHWILKNIGIGNPTTTPDPDVTEEETDEPYELTD